MFKQRIFVSQEKLKSVLQMLSTRITKGYRKWLLLLFILLLGGGIIVWKIFTEKFEDTGKIKEDHTVSAAEFIAEFKKDEAAANKKYTEKIVVVNGSVSEVKNADTSTNIIMADTSTGDYIIFAFQQEHLEEAKQVKAGDKVSIKGSCSGGNFSEILGVESISFKRCAINK
jgi:hypothetical protein